MTILTERDLQLTLPPHVAGRRFDDPASHGLSHCMKAIDFILEWPDRLVFLEIKDLDDPAARERERNRFIAKLQSGQLDRDVALKGRDSFVYEWCCERVQKPIISIGLIACQALDAAQLLTRTDALKRSLPIRHPHWRRSFITDCLVMNLAQWHRNIPEIPIRRLSEART